MIIKNVEQELYLTAGLLRTLSPDSCALPSLTDNGGGFARWDISTVDLMHPGDVRHGDIVFLVNLELVEYLSGRSTDTGSYDGAGALVDMRPAVGLWEHWQILNVGQENFVLPNRDENPPIGPNVRFRNVQWNCYLSGRRPDEDGAVTLKAKADIYEAWTLLNDCFGAVTLTNDNGESWSTDMDISSLVPAGYNDNKTASLTVSPNCVWIAYQNTNFGGNSAILMPGTYSRDELARLLDPSNPHPSISSLRRLPDPSRNPNVLLFSTENYGGQMVRFEGEVDLVNNSNPQLREFNDQAKSYIVLSGNWRLYQNKGFTGDTKDIGADENQGGTGTPYATAVGNKIGFGVSGITPWPPEGAFSNWMSRIDDGKYLSDLTIPGTHDSCARWGTFGPITISCLDITRTQTQSITQQLQAGLRFFDIRCRNCGDYFEIYHGNPAVLGVDQHLRLEEVLDQCNQFLAANPSEFIVMSIKDTTNPSDPSAQQAFERTFRNSYLNRAKWCTDSQIPKVGNIRGHIVLNRQFVSSDSNFGLDTSSYPGDHADCTVTIPNSPDTIRLQDHYKVFSWSYDDKWNYIQALLDKASNDPPNLAEKTLYINFISGSTGLLPYTVARGFFNKRGMNYRLYDYVLPRPVGQTRLGIIALDYPNHPESLVERLIRQNPLSSWP